MKVAVFEGIRKIRLEERPELKAASGEVIVKVKYCGICGSDLHTYLQGGRHTGHVMGHEVTGTITEVGRKVEGWQTGERVVISPPGSFCGECYYCRRGLPNKCVHTFERTIGLSPGADGGMAEYIRVKYPQNMLFRVPDNGSFEQSVLADTMSVALRGIRVSRFRVGDNVVVSGAGSIGYSTIQFLRLGGARHITVLEPSEKKRKLILNSGFADVALNPIKESNSLQQKVIDIYDGIGADIAFECSGTPQGLKSLLGLMKSDGQVLIFGGGRGDTPISQSQLTFRELEIKTSFAYAEDDMSISLDFLRQRRFNTKGMISDIISLDDVVEKGFERLAANRDLMKIVIAP